jgi:hypothetical protein
MTGLPEEVLLGPELTGTWEWIEGVRPGSLPAGLVVDHGDHDMRVVWAGVNEDAQFTLDSLLPLTVVEVVQCTICGVTGRIVEGEWVGVSW